MAINVDLSKPLTDEQIAELRTKLPENLVQHYIARAAENAPEPEPAKAPAPKAPAPKGGKADDLL